ncbi:hypothetical protein AURDEDRAFT_177010 [Auricularia subglabra TFB-10046 SS5]|uniref:Uncharacterized protein n=1 Tax=Auricularia subglabra (strain TFB-10046 / SS5) TaxID=717982 RepID=J0WNG8_AURST|nr:hypothetical protein AURDEDRAFT_177010 [Auricularia subglabra TFB-10046 SS5]
MLPAPSLFNASSSRSNAAGRVEKPDDGFVRLCRTAQRLAATFPVVLEQDDLSLHTIDDVDVAYSIVERAIDPDDDSANPDPDLPVPAETVLRIIRRSHRLAGLQPEFAKDDLPPDRGRGMQQQQNKPARRRSLSEGPLPPRKVARSAGLPDRPADVTYQREERPQLAAGLLHRACAEPFLAVDVAGWRARSPALGGIDACSSPPSLCSPPPASSPPPSSPPEHSIPPPSEPPVGGPDAIVRSSKPIGVIAAASAEADLWSYHFADLRPRT